jgi:dynein light intermediate chain 1, cytosolic
MLGIHSTLRRQTLKHNVIDRDRILIPPNWDSWGKIRILREGFDVEGINDGWGLDIQPPGDQQPQNEDEPAEGQGAAPGRDQAEHAGPLATYEEMVQDPSRDRALTARQGSPRHLEVETLKTQEFLAGQMEVMERLKAEEQAHDKTPTTPTGSAALRAGDGRGVANERSRVHDHIGPVQFNMGGIQVDAEDMIKRLKDREREEAARPEAQATVATPESKPQNEALASFFAGLMKRGTSSSPRAPPANPTS